MDTNKRFFGRSGVLSACCLAAGLTLGVIGTQGLAQVAPPTEHKGLNVETLGVVSEESMKATVGLDGHILLLRRLGRRQGERRGHVRRRRRGRDHRGRDDGALVLQSRRRARHGHRLRYQAAAQLIAERIEPALHFCARLGRDCPGERPHGCH